MKKFDFSLQRVLNFKQQTTDILMSELSQLNSHSTQLGQEIIDINNDYRDTGNMLQEKMIAGVNSSDIQVHKAYLSNLNIKALQTKQKKIEVDHLVELKKQEIIAARSEVASLEKLKEAQLVEYNLVLSKSNELFIEEFVANRS